MTKLTWQEMLNKVRAEHPDIKKQTEIFKMAKERYNNQTSEALLNTPVQAQITSQPTAPFEQHPIMQQVAQVIPLSPMTNMIPKQSEPMLIYPSKKELIWRNKMDNRDKARQYDSIFRQAGYRVIGSGTLIFLKTATIILSLAVIGLAYLNFRSLI